MSFFGSEPTDSDDFFCSPGPARKRDWFLGFGFDGLDVDGARNDFESTYRDAIEIGGRLSRSSRDAQESLAGPVGFCQAASFDPSPAVIASHDVELGWRYDGRDPRAVGIEARGPADHRHVEESIVEDLDTMGANVVC